MSAGSVHVNGEKSGTTGKIVMMIVMDAMVMAMVMMTKSSPVPVICAGQ